MKVLILTCFVVMSFQEGSEACFAKSTPPAKPSPSSSGSNKNPGRNQPEPEGNPSGEANKPIPPKPEMPSIGACMSAGFPGSQAYNECFAKFSSDMAKYAKEIKAWNAQYGGGINGGDGDFGSGNNMIYSNGWKIKSSGGSASMNNMDGTTRISMSPDGHVDQVRGQFLGGNTMQWALMRGESQVGSIEVRPPAEVNAKELKYQYLNGELKIWQ